MYPNLNADALSIRAQLPEVIALARDHGFEGVDFSIGEAADLVDRHGLQYVQALFASAKIKPGSWDFPVDFRRDEATWRQSLGALPRLANLAQALGCERTATWIMPCSDELEFQANFDFHVARLQPAAQVLSDYGCRLGLEFVGPKTMRATQRYEFIYTLAGMLELCQAIGTGNVGLLLDAYHLYTSHGSLAEVRRLTHQQIVIVHVNDAPAGVPVDEQLDQVRALPGETGVLDMVDFLQTLQSLGYDGPVTPEPFSQRLRTLPPAQAAQEAGQAMRRVWQMAKL
ncbi:MAG TPA: sugar phosphate isomerase/epimerase family protein [Anaerolineae bacterium]|nr:sugar phosphate isomerase/epimerase family protein [Anaerolineae bacterium]